MADVYRQDILPIAGTDLVAAMNAAARFGWVVVAANLVAGSKPKVATSGPQPEPAPAYQIIYRRPEWVEGAEEAARQAMSLSLAEMLEKELAPDLVEHSNPAVRQDTLRRLLQALRGAKVVAAAQRTVESTKKPKAM